MKSCTSRQHQLDHLAMGDPNFAMSQDVFRELSRHIEGCPPCSGHALALLALESIKTKTLEGPTKASEEKLMAALPQNTRTSMPTWVRVAGFVLVTWGAFMIGRTQSAPEQFSQPNNTETTQVEEKSVPTISLNRHIYNKGFLAGRTLVVHEDN